MLIINRASLAIRSWQLLILLITLLFAVPVITIGSFVFRPSSEVWQHLIDNVLFEYLTNSLILMIGVAFGTFSMGIICAWLTSLCVFPGKQFLSWALLLPLAMPAYIIAYTYTGMLEFSGPVQSLLRELTGWRYGDYYFPPVRSIWGAICMLSLVLYPYVYLLARSAFLEQSVCVIEVSRSLGCSVWRSFFKVALPLARPAIVAGMSLVLMETLADYGTVAYFGVSVFTTGIFRTWFGLGDSAAAAKLASLLLFFVFTLVIVERWSRKQARYHSTTSSHRKLPQYKLSGWKSALAILACFLPLLAGFIFPAIQLISWSIETWSEMVDESFLILIWHSIELAMIAAVLAALIAIVLVYAKRVMSSKTIEASIRVVASGYAIPGTVVAIGVIIPLAWIDNRINDWLLSQFDMEIGLLLSGSMVALLFAYMVRFLSISIQSVESGLTKIKPSMDEAARSLGHQPFRVLKCVHLPLMRGSILTAILIVFVDVMKELPATLILRPFNFNTLAVRAFELASDERLADSSTAALMIVVVGLLPIFLLSRSIAHSRVGS
jgi:iron(III) transport system permease protein